MLCLLWFCLTTLSDWLKKHAPLSQPIKRKTKTTRDLSASIYDWFTLCFVVVVIGWSNNLDFGFTKLIRKPLYLVNFLHHTPGIRYHNIR